MIIPHMYQTLEEAINQSVENMNCVLQNENKTISLTGQDRFTFFLHWGNSYQNSMNCYSKSGFFGDQLSSTPEFKINYRSAILSNYNNHIKNLYDDFGIIGERRFYHVRWEGYTSATETEDYSQKYDVFFIEGQNASYNTLADSWGDIIYLRFFQIPTINNDGVNSFRGETFYPIKNEQEEFYWIYTQEKKYSNVIIGRPNLFLTDPDIIFNFAKGKYKAYVKTSLTSESYYSSNSFKFENSSDNLIPDTYAKSYICSYMEIHEGTLQPKTKSYNSFEPYIINQGTVNGLSYIFYGADYEDSNQYRLCVITGTQTSVNSSYPWNNSDIKCHNLVIYVDAKLIDMSHMFRGYDNTIKEVIFGAHAKFQIPINCNSAFRGFTEYGNGLCYVRSIYKYNKKHKIYPSDASYMFADNDMPFDSYFGKDNSIFLVETVDLTFCQNVSYMFKNYHAYPNFYYPGTISNLWSTTSVQGLFYNANVENVGISPKGIIEISRTSQYERYGSVTDLSYLYYGNTNSPTITSFNFNNPENISHVFEGCTSIQTVYFNLGIGGAISSIEPVATIQLKNLNSAFKNCTNLKTVSFEGVRIIAGTDSASYDGDTFTGCTNLNKLTCPKEVLDGVQIPLPHTMYDKNNNAYDYLVGGNLVLTK